MPDIAKACFNSIKTHADNHPVILITEKNYKDYITFPSYIIEKQQNGILDLTHFSDILRASLLRKYGGIWMDCTVLIPSKNRMHLFLRLLLSGVVITYQSIIIFLKEDGQVSFGHVEKIIYYQLL